MRFKCLFQGLNRVRSWLLLAGMALATCHVQAQAIGAGQGVTDTEIVLGVVTDLSGPVASVGAPKRDGMILAVEEINAAGGIHGRKIKLVVEDMAYDPKRAVLATQKLLTQDKVFALVGTLGSAMNQAVIPLALERSVPTLFPMASSDITFLPHHPLKFGMQPLSSEHMRVAVKYAYDKLGKRRFGIIYQDDETGQGVVRAAEAQLKVHGLSLLEKTSYKRGETNYSAQIARLKAANLDMLLLGTNPRETAAAAIEAKTQAWTVDKIVFSGLVSSVITLGGEAVDGLYGTTQFVGVSQEATPAYQAIVDRYKARFGRDIQDGANFGYTSIMMFAEGAKNAGRNLTPLTMSQGLEKLKNFSTPFQGSSFSFKLGDHAPPRDAMVMQVKGGKWVVVAGPMTY
ncbi:MAG: ABC transporter substrate-binding protein [Sulfuricaulis sp.]|nr:ABC transporter substrate-binding protein [Sulfuricaulis sp.]